MADSEVKEVKLYRRGLKRVYASEEPASVGKEERIRQSEYGERCGIKRSRSHSDIHSSDTGYTSEPEPVVETTADQSEHITTDVSSALTTQVEPSDSKNTRQPWERHSYVDRVTSDKDEVADSSENHETNSRVKHRRRNSSTVGDGNVDVNGGGSGVGVPAAEDMPNGVDDDEDDDDDDNVSEISGLSELSGAGRWHPMKGTMMWIHRQMERGTDPRDVLNSLVPADTDIPANWDNVTLWRLIISLMSEPARRKRLPDVTKIDDVVRLLQTSRKILVLTGAGVSVSCGIPDFRSANGIYARLAVDYPDLPNPQAMFDISYFRHNPKPFFQFAKEIYPGQFNPSLSHRFIYHLEKDGKLLRNYTQNIDTLEQDAGITRVVQCHGSFATASCMVCKHQVNADAVRADIMDQIIPKCPQCDPSNPDSILKPDIVFFGQSLPEEFHRQMQLDKDECDLLIVIGSSLKVQPVALIPSSLPPTVPQILINREPLRHLNFDVELLGDGDVIVNELCHRLGSNYNKLCSTTAPAALVTTDQITLPEELTVAPSRELVDTETLSSGKVSQSHESANKLIDTVPPMASTDTVAPPAASTDPAVTPAARTDTAAPPAASTDPVVTPAASTDTAAPPAASIDPVVTHAASTDTVALPAARDDSASPTVPSKASSANVIPSVSVPECSIASIPPHPGMSHAVPCDQLNSISKEQLASCDEDKSTELKLAAIQRPKATNWSSLLPADSFLSLNCRRYVFPGAEVYVNNSSNVNSVDTERSVDGDDVDNDDMSTSDDDDSDSDDVSSLDNESNEPGNPNELCPEIPVKIPCTATPVDSSDDSLDP